MLCGSLTTNRPPAQVPTLGEQVYQTPASALGVHIFNTGAWMVRAWESCSGHGLRTAHKWLGILSLESESGSIPAHPPINSDFGLNAYSLFLISKMVLTCISLCCYKEWRSLYTNMYHLAECLSQIKCSIKGCCYTKPVVSWPLA